MHKHFTRTLPENLETFIIQNHFFLPCKYIDQEGNILSLLYNLYIFESFLPGFKDTQLTNSFITTIRYYIFKSNSISLIDYL